MKYLPVHERTPDTQYADVCRRVLDHGVLAPTRQGPGALTLMQQTMAYDLANGFPLIADRDLSGFWRKPINELCAFINGATTLAEFEAFGCDWWGPWATPAKTEKRGLPAGSLGPGSYGGAFHDFPTAEGPPFDQFRHLLEQVAEFPNDRTHFVSPWIPQYQVRGAGKRQQTTISPCHGWVHLRVLQDRLHLHMFQRSGDLPVGVPSNMAQYAALLLMVEQLTGFQAASFHHTISDAHVYEDQADLVRDMVGRDPRPLPTVVLNEAGRAVTEIHDFRGEHFDLLDYQPHPAMRFPVAP